jgi:hypothetical protein
MIDKVNGGILNDFNLNESLIFDESININCFLT